MWREAAIVMGPPKRNRRVKPKAGRPIGYTVITPAAFGQKDDAARRRRVDSIILARVAQGDPGAVRECIDRYGGLIWSLARRLLHTQAEAEDAVQEIFVEIWKNAGKYDPMVASETAFVAMLARRRLIDRRRKLDRRQDKAPLPDSASEPVQNAAWEAAPEEAIAAGAAMEQLTDEQRRCLRLSVYEGLSHEKIAVSTGLPLGTVKTHVRRGLIKIRQLLGGGSGGAAGEAAGEARESVSGEGSR